MKKVILIGIVAIVTSCGVDSTNSTSNTSTTISEPNFVVEGVQIKKDFKNAWTVSGMVRNKTSYPVKGAVKIKFLNSKGDVVHNNRAKVNDGDPIKAGQSASFDYTTDPSNFEDVDNFDVEFYER